MDLQKSGAALLEWHARTERDLPWRGERDAYRIWISETMLQQTRAAVAAKRYEEFLRAFPDVFALARAPEQEVLRLWQGMGYYARARNLHKAARQLVERHGGAFPQEEKELRALAGVGEYTACAVLSMAFDRPVAAVDANLTRVLSRVFALRGGAQERGRLLRETGERWLAACAQDRPGDFNRALMGLGALLCTAKKADCAACPLAEHCAAHALGEELVLPEQPPKKPRREEWRALAILIGKNRALVRKRPARGMLAGLWEFPHFLFDEAALSPENLAAALAQEGVAARLFAQEVCRSEFTFTHRKWNIRAWRGELTGAPPDGWLLADAQQLERLPVASVMEPYRQLALELLREGKHE
ncbi:MAG: A/G-specific adenine glycosylase [Eubacteriales bacterium]|nr:A/G-specific adenine glycosylase [Eubacteriales bacterium]